MNVIEMAASESPVALFLLRSTITCFHSQRNGQYEMCESEITKGLRKRVSN